MQCIGIALLMRIIVVQCNRIKLAIQWNYIAYKNNCAMHKDCIVYDKNTFAMHRIALLIIRILVQCFGIALLMMSTVLQCIRIASLMTSMVCNASGKHCL